MLSALGWMNWAPVLGLCQEPEHFIGPAYKSSFKLASWAWGVGLRAYFLNPITFLFHDSREPKNPMKNM